MATTYFTSIKVGRTFFEKILLIVWVNTDDVLSVHPKKSKTERSNTYMYMIDINAWNYPCC